MAVLAVLGRGLQALWDPQPEQSDLWSHPSTESSAQSRKPSGIARAWHGTPGSICI